MRWDATSRGEDSWAGFTYFEFVSCFAWEYNTRKLKIPLYFDKLTWWECSPSSSARNELIVAHPQCQREHKIRWKRSQREERRCEKIQWIPIIVIIIQMSQFFMREILRTTNLLLRPPFWQTNKEERAGNMPTSNRTTRSSGGKEGRERDTLGDRPTRRWEDQPTTIIIITRWKRTFFHNEIHRFQISVEVSEASDDIALDSRRRIKRLFQLFNIFFAYKNRLTDGLARLRHTIAVANETSSLFEH